MDSGPVSCNFVGSKAMKPKKVLEEAREIRNPELDLVEKGISAFEELPGLCKSYAISSFTFGESPTFTLFLFSVNHHIWHNLLNLSIAMFMYPPVRMFLKKPWRVHV